MQIINIMLKSHKAKDICTFNTSSCYDEIQQSHKVAQSGQTPKMLREKEEVENIIFNKSLL